MLTSWMRGRPSHPICGRGGGPPRQAPPPRRPRWTRSVPSGTSLHARWTRSVPSGTSLHARWTRSAPSGTSLHARWTRSALSGTSLHAVQARSAAAIHESAPRAYGIAREDDPLVRVQARLRALYDPSARRAGAIRTMGESCARRADAIQTLRIASVAHAGPIYARRISPARCADAILALRDRVRRTCRPDRPRVHPARTSCRLVASWRQGCICEHSSARTSISVNVSSQAAALGGVGPRRARRPQARSRWSTGHSMRDHA
jgi:hypothetical protein